MLIICSVGKLQRKEAFNLLMDLINLNLALPSLATLKESKPGDFNLVLKAIFDVQALKDYAASKNLFLELDEKRGLCVLSDSDRCLLI